MPTSEKTTCQQCGAVLPEDRPGSLCLRCVLEVAVDFDQPRRDTKDATLDDTSSLTREVDDVVEGARIGPYKILQKIGEGGFGMVYMAAQSGAVHRRVALKIIKAGMDTRQVIARFEAERQALAMMDHPNIARVFDAGETETGRPYFVMELVKGIPLSQFCREENLDTTARLHLFIQVCKAVQHAHLKGVIHRDLKPSNVLVTLHDGEAVPKVIDFGIAKAIDQELTDKTLFTRYEQMIGTPAYMSPEQAALSGLDVDTRSDVYALGVLLYEILTGTTPFDAKTLREAAFDEMRRIIREEEPPRPSTRLTALRTEQQAGERLAPISVPGSEVARDLDWVVMKALEKDRSRRYDTAGGLARDVERYLANEPVEAGAPTLRYKMGKFIRRNRIPAAAAAAVALAIVTGLALALWGMFRATAAEKVAKGEAAAAEVAREAATAEAAAAREAREVEAAMNAFLMEDLLGQASPHESMEPDLELRTVLERASTNLGDRFAGRPRIEAEMRLKLGAVYEALSLREEAHAHFERAAELLERELRSESPDYLKARHGEVRTLSGPIESRIKALKELLPIHERVLGPDHLETIAVQYSLARNYGGLVERGLQSASLVREGLELSKQVAEARTRILGEEDPSTIDSMGIHAYLLILAGESEKAEAKLLYLLSVLKEDTFRYSTHKAGCLNLLGMCRSKQHDRAGTVRYFREGLQVSQRTLGPLHSRTTTLILNLLWDLKPEDVLPFAEETLPAYLSSTEGAERRGQFLFQSFESLAAGGFFAEAASYHLKAAELFSSSGTTTSLPFLEQATLYALMSGDRDLYETACQQMLEQKGASADSTVAAQTALRILLAPCDGPLLAQAGELAERAFSKDENSFWNRFVVVLADYRRGEYERALDRLAPLLKRSEEVDKDLEIDVGAFSEEALTLAMSSLLREAVGQTESAQREYEKAAALAEMVFSTGEHRAVPGSWATASILLAEAQAKLAGEPVTAVDPTLLWKRYIDATNPPAHAHAIVEAPGEWRYLHLADGSDPMDAEPAFFNEFFRLDYDDAHWEVGSESDTPPFGFGYGDPAAVKLETPESGNRHSAYFRHPFRTEVTYDELWLRLVCDDGVIIYLDGEEVGRFAVHPHAKVCHELQAYGGMAYLRPDEQQFRHFKLHRALEPGEHVLAVSVHNMRPDSSDLHLGRVTLLGTSSRPQE